MPLFVLDDGRRGRGLRHPQPRGLPRRLPRRPRRGAARARRPAGAARAGTWSREACRVADGDRRRQVHVAAGASALRAAARGAAADGAGPAVRRGCASTTAWSTAVPPGAVTPAGTDHFAVFTPYFRRWETARAARCRWRAPARGARPGRCRRPEPLPGAPDGHVARAARGRGGRGPRRAGGRGWRRGVDRVRGPARRPGGRRHLAAVAVPALRLPVRRRAGPARPGRGRAGRGRVRTAAGLAGLPPPGARRPPGRRLTTTTASTRRPLAARDGPRGATRGGEGRTGYPIVDAAMRQLRRTRAGCTTGRGCSPRAS